MYNLISAVTCTILTLSLFLSSQCKATLPGLPENNVVLQWRPAEAKPLPGQYVLIKIGCNEDCTGYILYCYEEFVDSLIDIAGGYHFIVPPQPNP